MTNVPKIAAVAAALLLLSACEKPAGPTNAVSGAGEVNGAPSQTVASALPALPMLTNPVFGPDFVDKAGSGDLFEITESKLALSRSTNPQVKDFAGAMIAAHTKSTAALQKAVDESGETVDLPTALPDDLQTKVAALTLIAAGSAFDKAYVADQIAAHQDALGALQNYARRGDTPALKTFAAAAAPVVADHLTRANTLQASLK